MDLILLNQFDELKGYNITNTSYEEASGDGDDGGDD